MAEPVTLVPTRPDAEIAAGHREKIIQAAQVLCAALTDCKRDGFDVGVNFGLVTVYPPTVGLSNVTISKVF
jgi:hypothetical protein